MATKTHTDPEKPNAEGTAENEDTSPVEEVALVVPETDDPTLPVLTFRAWFLGLVSCALNLSQHFLHLPYAAAHHLRNPHANLGLAHWQVHGQDSTNHPVQPSRVALQLESWAVQHQGACHHHHLRQLRGVFWWG